MWFDLLFYIWVVVDFFSSPGIPARLTSIPVGFPQCLCSYPRISRRFRGKSVIPRRVHISRVNSVIKLNTRELWRDLIVMTDVDCCRWRSIWNIAADWRPHLSRMWHHWLLNFSCYAMHERDPAIMQCLSVCVSVFVTFVDCVKTNKHIFKMFSPSGSQALLFFCTKWHGNILTRTPLTGASNSGGIGRNHDSEPRLYLVSLYR